MANRFNLINNTILITGGSSGIGLGLGKVLLEMGNTVIICGRSEEKLRMAKTEMPNVHAIQCDIADPGQREALYTKVIHEHPGLNILINNAATVDYLDILDKDYSHATVDQEIQTNFIGPVGLINLFMQHLMSRGNSSIINITTGLIYAPMAAIAGYSASKAALHSYTQSLRIRLKDSGIKVIEVMMTAADTPFHDGGSIPSMAISRDKAVTLMIKGLNKPRNEVKIGNVKALSWVARIAPKLALRIVNKG